MFRFGLVGLGYWGPNYARVVGELPECELVVACDRNDRALDVVRSRWPNVATTTELDEAVEWPDVDAVIVATPTSTHYEVALAALRAGRHVLCEKPLAASVVECDELIAAAELAGTTLSVGHVFLFNPAVRAMRELIERGMLGQLVYAHATRASLGPIRPDANALWDLAPHDLSILFYLFDGDPVAVSALGRAFLRPGVEDVVFAQLSFPGGAIAGLHLSWLDPYKIRRVTAVGDRSMVVFDDVAVDEKLKVFDKGASYESVSESARGTEYGEYRAMIRDGDIVIPKVKEAEPLKEQVIAFMHTCRDGQPTPCDGDAGRRVVAVLEAATRSLRAGGEPVELTALAGRRA